jgi:hypothetical protein
VADFLLQLAAGAKGIERALARLRGLQAGIEALNTAARATASGPLRDAAGTMAKVGRAATHGLAKLSSPALQAQGPIAHMAASMTEAMGVAEQLAPAHLKLIASAEQHADSIAGLRDAHATNLDYAHSLTVTTRRLGGVLENLRDSTNDAAAFFVGWSTTLARIAWNRARPALGFPIPAKEAVPLTAVVSTSFSGRNTALAILSASLKHAAEAGRSFEALTTILNHVKAADAVRDSAGGRGPGAMLARLKDTARRLDRIQRGQFLPSVDIQQRSIQRILISWTDQWAPVHKRLADLQGAGARRAAALAVTADATSPHWAGFGARLTTMIPQAFAAGANLLETLAPGIRALSRSIRAVEQFGSAIVDHLKMHSRVRLMPLRELGHLALVESLAESIRPAPMISAMRRVATVAAVAMPIMVGSAARPAAAGAAPIVVNVSVNYTISRGASDDFVKTAEKHGRELARIIQRELERHERTKFS